MKKALSILMLTLGLCGWSFGQITSIGGALRYEHEYQDLAYNDQLSTIVRSNPVIDLGISGIALSPKILAFNVRTALNLNSGTSNVGGLSLSNQQSYWNAYDGSVSFFPYSPIKFELAARDHIIENTSNYGGFSSFRGETRSQEQRARFALSNISFLPTISINLVQDRSWAVIGDPEEQVNHQLSFSMASATGQSSSVNLSGSFTDTKERYTGIEDKMVSLQLTGSKELSSRQRVDVGAEYTRYSYYSTLTGNTAYTGSLSDKLRISTGFSGSQSTSSYSTYTTAGASQSLNYAASDHFRFGLSVNGGTSKYSYLTTQTSEINPSFGTLAMIQHNRTFGGASMANSVSFGYTVRNYGELYHIWEGDLANSLTTNVGSFSVSGEYDLASRLSRTTLSGYSISHNGSITGNGMVFGSIRSQSSVRFRSDDYVGDIPLGRNQHNLNFTQGFDGQYLYYIPMTLGAGGMVNWYFTNLLGHTYGWYFSFTSSRFFLRGSFLNYRYSRNFDPYYQREIVEHNGSFNYQWRALIFQVRFRQTSFPNRIRDITLAVSRPF